MLYPGLGTSADLLAEPVRCPRTAAPSPLTAFLKLFPFIGFSHERDSLAERKLLSLEVSTSSSDCFVRQILFPK